MGFPEKYGLYDSDNEHENCGFGFIANIKNEPKHEIVHQALEIVHNLDHRGDFIAWRRIGGNPSMASGRWTSGCRIRSQYYAFGDSRKACHSTSSKIPMD